MDSGRSHLLPDSLRGLLADANLNFLIGAGASVPAIPALGELETLSAQVGSLEASELERTIAQASLDWAFLDNVVARNVDLVHQPKGQQVLDTYENLLAAMHRILIARKNPLLPKQINIFTTNNDVFFEHGFDKTGLELNDGFKGRLRPTFRFDNFRTRLFHLTARYDNAAEIPVFNLYKVHGSVTWAIDLDRAVVLDQNLEGVTRAVRSGQAAASHLIPITDTVTASDLLEAAQGKHLTDALQVFMDDYANLPIVNPTKSKFAKTVLEQTYYDMLRLFSNELEREATALFVMGFSFADEHLRGLVTRACNSNPTLLVYVFCYTDAAKTEIEAHFVEERFTYDNLLFVGPSEFGRDDIEVLDVPTLTRLLFDPIAPPSIAVPVSEQPVE